MMEERLRKGARGLMELGDVVEQALDKRQEVGVSI